MLPGILFGTLLVFTVVLGGSETGVFHVSFQVANAVIGAVLVALWIAAMRRDTDTVDLLVIGGLIAFLATCVTSTYPRQSFDAATAALTWTAAFGVGRRLLVDPRHRLLGMRLLGVCGLVLAAGFAVIWGAVWLEWVRTMGGIPPFDLTLPPHIYRHYYVVAMLLAGLLPASVYLLKDRVMRMPAVITIALTLPMTLMSGSRTVWLGLLVAGAAAILIHRPSRRVLLGIGAIAAGGLALAVAADVMGTAADRLFAGSTVTYRLDIWRSAIELWATDVLTGIGPGSIGIGLTLTDLTDQYTFINRHADNAFVQLAAEGGLLGLIGGAVVVGSIARGSQLDLPGSRAALVGLVLFGAMALTNNPTDSPNLVALSVFYAATLAPHRPPALDSTPQGGLRMVAMRVATWGLATVVVLAVASVNVAGALHAGARSAAASGNRSEAAKLVSRAIAFDPSLALYRRERGVLLMDVDPRASLRDLKRAVELNPADVAALRALALQANAMGDAALSRQSAALATKVRPLSAENWIVLGLVSSGADTTASVAEALRLAPWLAGSSAWPGELSETIPLDSALAVAADATHTRPTPRDLMSVAWLQGITERGVDLADIPAYEALQQVLACKLDDAGSTFESIGEDWVATTPGIVGRLMLARIRSDPSLDELISVASLREPDLAAAARNAVSPYSAFVSLSEDPMLYRRVGIGPALDQLVLPRTLDALSDWLVSPTAAARRAVSGGALAECS